MQYAHRLQTMSGVAADDSFKHQFQKLKARIHHELIESLEIAEIDQLDSRQLQAGVRRAAEQMCNSCPEMLSRIDRERMVKELMDETFGLGPLEDLMQDPTVADILVNNAKEVYAERHGRLEKADVVFADDEHLLRIIRRVAARVGRRIDEVNPLVDARLPDGSRVNATVPPLTLDGPSLSIRRFGHKPLAFDDLAANNAFLPEMGRFLAACVEARISFLISGGTGAGKTTMLNALTAFVPPEERLITIEDAAELVLQHRHVVRMESRPANTEGAGALTQRDLVRNSLRMRPDRIIVGEVRGAEALDMLQAMNTGHEGSLTTIHANDTRDALARLELMVAMAGFDLPVPVVRRYVAAGITLVVHLARLKGGLRRVVGVSEIVGVKDGSYDVKDIFGFEQTGVDADGVAKGEFLATGYQPQCLKRLHAAGIELPADTFAPRPACGVAQPA